MPSSLQTLPLQGNLEAISARLAKVAAFSLPAGVATEVHERQ